jgi:RNA polymerase sigma-70 factor (ECF subfamily)
MEAIARLEESSLVAALRAGDADAFNGIVEHYQTPIFRYLFRLTGDYELARDLAQDTFLQAYKAILKTDAELHLKAWLYRIATNNALQYRRRKRLLAFILFEDWRKTSPESVKTSFVPDAEGVQQALQKVSVEYRVCLVLHFVEGFKYEEIGRTLGISEEAVRKRVARGKQAFRRMFRGGEEG